MRIALERTHFAVGGKIEFDRLAAGLCRNLAALRAEHLDRAVGRNLSDKTAAGTGDFRKPLEGDHVHRHGI